MQLLITLHFIILISGFWNTIISCSSIWFVEGFLPFRTHQIIVTTTTYSYPSLSSFSDPQDVPATSSSAARKYNVFSLQQYTSPREQNQRNAKPNNKQFRVDAAKRRRYNKHPLTTRRAKAIAKGRDPLLSLNINLDHLAKSGRAVHAEELLVKIEKLHAEGYYAIRPDSVSYNSVINAYALNDSPNYDSVKEVERLLKRMEALTEQGCSSVQPTIVTLNTVAATFAKNGQPEKARQLLNDMEAMYQNGSIDMGPNTITFNSVICAFAKAKRPHEAEEILKQMMIISRQDDGKRANEIKADSIAFNTVLHAWAVACVRGAPQRAQQLLEHMIKLHNSGNEDVKPDVFSYTATLSAWAAAKNDPHAANHALELLHKMESECAVGNDDVCPNTVAYTAVINSLGRSGRPGAALKAYDILVDMERKYRQGNEDLKPDLISYSSVIDAFARSGEEYAGEKAVELLDHMITLAEEGHKEYGPNTQVYCSVISALGKSKTRGSADAANQLLLDMEKMYAFGNTDVAPNTIIFNAVIDAWARSSFVFKALKAQSLLEKMEDEVEAGNIMYKPDIITYNSVISACANTYGDADVKSRAFGIAIDAFKRIQLASDIKPSSRTYSLLLKAVRKLVLSQKEKEKMSKKIMAYCIRDGLFNEHVLSQLTITSSSQSTTLNMLKHLGYEGENLMAVETYPRSWGQNSDR
mmetsp:Transcript_12736/g.23879  ORF Transcript_12736/g.23879 Transcript_12736/m.23879 type:complete len:696 (+) Transcript_12736:72-2159(+)